MEVHIDHISSLNHHLHLCLRPACLPRRRLPSRCPASPRRRQHSRPARPRPALPAALLEAALRRQRRRRTAQPRPALPDPPPLGAGKRRDEGTKTMERQQAGRRWAERPG